MLKIVNVCGARPNFMKIAPLVRAYRQYASIHSLLVHTGQHYDETMSELFFRQLSIPEPDINLGVGSGSHAAQTAEIMKRFEPVLEDHRPDWVVVVGDVNSTLACALVATKLGVKVAHVEAGLRSFDRTMPEEVNRLLTDSIADLLFVSEPSGLENLKREGIDNEKVHFVGNVMIDTLMRNRAKADESSVLVELGLRPREYVVVTLHRPSNVDSPETFRTILDAFERILEDMPIVFPMHPRTRRNIAEMGMGRRVTSLSGLHIPEPMGYLDFLKLMAECALVMTDSGGIQEETTILEVPCVTLRESTERPVTITHGTNRLARLETTAILEAYVDRRTYRPDPARKPELWDGHAAERIAAVFQQTGLRRGAVGR
ncbi:MAG: UDP-N-acetylglucosamine 2-epimerase (non-hydrolyzing) [Phycisphaerales bacterium]|nr:MAG: UDP-N-acetylglucosamine 2-epimerase (non-hydrolyzing) [Phycisphaerales bacterium]